MWCNILFLNAHEIAGSELAIDGKIEHHGVVPRIDRTFLVRSGGFGPVSLPLFRGVRFGMLRLEFPVCMVLLLGY
jgi:hypothetical protein